MPSERPGSKAAGTAGRLTGGGSLRPDALNWERDFQFLLGKDRPRESSDPSGGNEFRSEASSWVRDFQSLLRKEEPGDSYDRAGDDDADQDRARLDQDGGWTNLDRPPIHSNPLRDQRAHAYPDGERWQDDSTGQDYVAAQDSYADGDALARQGYAGQAGRAAHEGGSSFSGASSEDWNLDRRTGLPSAQSDLSQSGPMGQAGERRQQAEEGPPEGARGRVPVPRERGHYPAPRRDAPPAYYSTDLAYGEQPPEAAAGIDLRKYLWLAFKHRWLILGTAGVFLVVGLLWTLLTTPIYRATATLQIDREAPKVISLQDVPQADPGHDVEFYQTQYEILKSRSLAERVAENLDLGDDPVFLAADAPSPWSKVRHALFGSGGASDKPSLAARQEAAAMRVQGGLLIEPVRTSSVVRISFDSPNATVAATVVNAIEDNFISASLERRVESSTYAKNFLEDRIQELKVKLEDSEKQLVAYADKQDIVDFQTGSSSGGQGETQNIVAVDLAAADQALSKAAETRIQAEQLWHQAENSDGLSLPQILENKAVQDIRSQRAGLEAEYNQKLKSFKPAYPDMVQLKAKIDELDNEVASEVNLVKASLKSEYDAAVEQEKTLAARVEEMKSGYIDVRNRNIQYNILRREVDTNRTLYEGLLQRYKEIGIAGGVGTNNISVVDRAQIPSTPHSPKLKTNLLISLVLGLMAGVLAALAREHLDDSFRSSEEIEQNLGLPLLGIIPKLEAADEQQEAWDDPRSAVSEAYRSLRTALQFSTASGIPKTLLLTSSRPSEGKSTTAYALARNFAQLGQRVLLIDCDLRKPSLNNFIHCDDSAGLTNCLAGDTKPPEVFQPTSLPNMTFLPCGPLPPNPAELLAGPKMLSLLTIASEKFDQVIIDGPPVAGLADAPLLASVAKGTLLVIEASRTRRGTARTALKRLDFARAQLVGVVLNKLDSSNAAYGYGYGYGENDYYGYGSKAPEQLTASRSTEA